MEIVAISAARNTEPAKEDYNAVKGEAQRLGRDPDTVFVCNLLMTVVAATNRGRWRRLD